MAAGQVLAGDPELAVGRGAEGVDDRVVALARAPRRSMSLADLDVAEEAEALAGGGLLVDADHRLDLRVVGRDAAADEAERRREAVEEVDLGVRALVLEEVLGGVEAGRAGADDRDAQRVVSDAAGSGSASAERVVAGARRRRGSDRGGGGAVERVERAGRRDIATQVKIGVSRSV